MEQLSDAGVCAVRVGNGASFDYVAAGKYQLGIRCYVDLSSANVLFILLVAIDEAHCISTWLEV